MKLPTKFNKSYKSLLNHQNNPSVKEKIKIMYT